MIKAKIDYRHSISTMKKLWRNCEGGQWPWL